MNSWVPRQKPYAFTYLQGAELLSENDLKRVAKPEELQWNLGGHRDPSPSHWVEIHQVSFPSTTQDPGSQE
jgi:hypothetical protein